MSNARRHNKVRIVDFNADNPDVPLISDGDITSTDDQVLRKITCLLRATYYCYITAGHTG